MGVLTLMLANKTSEVGKLIVGLPVMHYDSLKEKFLSSVKQTHMVDLLSSTGEILNRKYITIPSVKVLPQPIGTLFDCLYDELGEIVYPNFTSSKTGIIDIGYNTLDLAWIDNLNFVSTYSTSLSGLGVISVYQNLAQEIYQHHNIAIPVEHIEPLQIRVGLPNVISTFKHKKSRYR